MHTGSGGVRIAFGSGSGFNLNVHASSGSIRTELPITVQGSLSHNELKGSVRGGVSGSGNLYRFRRHYDSMSFCSTVRWVSQVHYCSDKRPSPRAADFFA